MNGNKNKAKIQRWKRDVVGRCPVRQGRVVSENKFELLKK